MEKVMTILPFIAFAAVWFGVARFYKTKGKGAIIRHFTGFATGFLALIIGIILIAPDPKNTDTPTAQSEQVTKVPELEKKLEQNEVKEELTVVEKQPEAIKEQAKVSKDIGITPKQFAKRVNAYLENLGFPSKMPTNLQIQKGEVNDTAQVMLTKHLAITLSINKQTGNIKGVMTNLTLSDDLKTNLLLFGANANVMAGFAGKNEQKKLGREFLLMSTNVMKDYSEAEDKNQGAERSLNYKGMKFGMMANALIGVFSYGQFEE